MDGRVISSTSLAYSCSRYASHYVYLSEFVGLVHASNIVYYLCDTPLVLTLLQEFKLKDVGPCIELYGDDCIRYFEPLDHREGFFVPEVSQEAGAEEESKKDQ